MPQRSTRCSKIGSADLQLFLTLVAKSFCASLWRNSVNESSRRIAAREFDGDHEIPADVAREGLSWVSKAR